VDAAPAARAVGSLPGGGWVGFAPTPDGYRLQYGPAASATGGGRDSRALLVAAAIAYFEESLAEAPSGLEATQSDLASLLSWLRGGAGSPAEEALLARACDAVDDGLPGDAVALILRAVLVDLMPNEQADPVDLLVAGAIRG